MSEAETGTEAMPEVEEELNGIDVEQPLVGIIMGSASDKETMAKAEPILLPRTWNCDRMKIELMNGCASLGETQCLGCNTTLKPVP